MQQVEFEKFYQEEQDRMWEKRMAKWRAERVKREQLLQKVLEERRKQIASRSWLFQNSFRNNLFYLRYRL